MQPTKSQVMDDRIEKINDGSEFNEAGYNKVESWNKETITEMSALYKRLLKLIGEDPEREGLLRTPERVSKSMNFLMSGYSMNPEEILRSAMFK